MHLLICILVLILNFMQHVVRTFLSAIIFYAECFNLKYYIIKVNANNTLKD